jgi:hypothetical protein
VNLLWEGVAIGQQCPLPFARTIDIAVLPTVV